MQKTVEYLSTRSSPTYEVRVGHESLHGGHDTLREECVELLGGAPVILGEQAEQETHLVAHARTAALQVVLDQLLHQTLAANKRKA